MIDGEQRGPFELNRLAEAGVRPDTYVWCKTMPDWKKAREVAEICRYYRQHLAGTVNAPVPAAREKEETGNLDSVPLSFRRIVEKSGFTPGPPADNEPDTSQPPRSYLGVAIAITFLCFPLTGLVAIYFAVMTRRLWAEGCTDREDAEDYRRMAHDYSRQTKMWLGISFFLGLILYAFIGHIT